MNRSALNSGRLGTGASEITNSVQLYSLGTTKIVVSQPCSIKMKVRRLESEFEDAFTTQRNGN